MFTGSLLIHRASSGGSEEGETAQYYISLDVKSIERQLIKCIRMPNIIIRTEIGPLKGFAENGVSIYTEGLIILTAKFFFRSFIAMPPMLLRASFR